MAINFAPMKQNKHTKSQTGQDNSKPRNKALDFFVGFMMVVAPLIVAGPLTWFFFLCHEWENGYFFLVLAILTIVIYLVVVFVLFKCVLFGKPDPNWHPDPVSSGNDANVASAFFLGLVGGAMLDRSFRKNRKSLYDDARDSFLWQEKIRRDNNIHDYYGEDF